MHVIKSTWIGNLYKSAHTTRSCTAVSRVMPKSGGGFDNESKDQNMLIQHYYDDNGTYYNKVLTEMSSLSVPVGGSYLISQLSLPLSVFLIM